ncbi:family 2A encapsulin nanocompartment cargo protein cysteine desulfurase [Flavobacterium sp.]|uniref:family 2A encapsulin nanocompartment cargo protein cysteine desulfurase n=1 Tax=Flavobacterium sp. TaxID=239 RepID=UPI002C2E7A29|nr:family 2A encapsulin nanocompartment cargo protein cysteine desulfurase [Flavobacterium sp.]HSD06348.1 family 2A encapsulin nanocompartment cargo protein cysteine desulfurase [Flavobacterium sp.]
MSTNINSTGLPNVDDLQKLANELFSALPNEFPKEISLSPNASEHPRATKIAETLLAAGNLGGVETVFPVSNHDTLLGQTAIAPLATPAVSTTPVGSLQTPPSFGGFGLSPSVAQYGKSPDFAGYSNAFSDPAIENISQLSDPNFDVKNGFASTPVSGNGTSNSPIQNGNNVNIGNPQTGFNDVNLKNGGNNSSSALNQNYLPFETEHSSFELELKAALEALNASFGIPNLVTTPAIIDKPNSYYFLNENPFGYDSKKTDVPLVNHNEFAGFSGTTFDAHLIKKDFPILSEIVNGKPLIWFDNAATTQKPQSVIDRVSYFYEHENSNIHRAAHELAARASDAYEAAREKVRVFLNAKSVNEIVFVRGATEGINLVAESWGNHNLVAGDEIVVSNLEHHANIVPWKRLADKKGLKLRVIPVDDDGQILLEEYGKLLNAKTKLVAFTQVSNALGTVTPAKEMVEMAHAAGAKVLLDGAQSVSHMKVDVQYLNADWLVFSGHKLFGPTGIGAVYGKEDLLNEMEPYQSGGNMIQDVTFDEIKYHKAPNRFEAGTGNIADAIGLGAAIDYVSRIGIEAIGHYEHYLLEYATNLLKQIPGVRLIGTAANKASVLSFNLQGFTNDEVGQALNKEGIAVRTGHHCAQPILRRMGVETSVRPSLAFYNTTQDVDVFIETLWRLKSGKK